MDGLTDTGSSRASVSATSLLKTRKDGLFFLKSERFGNSRNKTSLRAMSIIKVTPRTARKQHECNACRFLFETDYRNMGATFSDYRKISAARRVDGKILPGEKYEEVFCNDDGAFTYRQKPDIHEICEKYDVYFE